MIEMPISDFAINGCAGPFNLADTAPIETILSDAALLGSMSGAHARLKPSHIIGDYTTPPQLLADSHLTDDAVMALAQDANLLDCMGSVMEQDMYLRRSQFWRKPAGSRGVIWHQDTHKQRELGEIGERSAWVALEDTDIENGCVWVLKGSSQAGIVPPDTIMDALFRVRFFANSEIQVPAGLEAYEPIPMALRKGQFFIFHQLCFHASGPNRSAGTRTGLAFRYVPAGRESSLTESLTKVGPWAR
jgi:ectoine hydroxylase-related dioxygenase (phytanoyl-CoA dioxygenase family)